jgi:hypothetical protein
MPTSRNNCTNGVWACHCCNQRTVSASAGIKIADLEIAGVWILHEPVCSADQSLGKQSNIEAELPRPVIEHLISVVLLSKLPLL